MSLFFSQAERAQLKEARWREPLCSLYEAMQRRVEQRASRPGLSDPDATMDWWHYASDYLTDAAFIWSIKPTPSVSAWLRDAMLSVARRPLADWIGPAFRAHGDELPLGHLETGHLSWGLAISLDLAGDVLSASEREEVVDSLRNHGMALCRNWLDHTNHLNNWRCILLAGYAVAAAVLDDGNALDYARGEFIKCVDYFQADGSYGESLQYGDYALSGLVLIREALERSRPDWASKLPLEPYVYKPRWDAASLLYLKPLSGWGDSPIPRSANFGDSAAVYGASADNLMHIAARAKSSHPTMAGLARWLFETQYGAGCGQLPPERNSFGFANGFGFLSLILFSSSAEAITPEEAVSRPLEAFTCGNVIARNTWQSRTTLATRTASEPLRAVAHLHADANSFILTHNQERLLADAGHTCYRSLVHGHDLSSSQHNILTLHDKAGSEIAQKKVGHRLMNDDGTNGAPVVTGGSLLLASQCANVTVIMSDVAASFGAPVKNLIRTWVLCGEHALFVIDRVCVSEPVTMTWNWLLNNRDDALSLKLVSPDRLVARRGNAGMKLFHLGEGKIGAPTYGYLHDAYHTMPGQLGEGKPGSGMLVRFRDETPRCESTVVHAICLDTPGAIYGWHMKQGDDGSVTLESPAKDCWTLDLDDNATRFSVYESVSGLRTSVRQQGEVNWTLINE